MAKHFNSRIQLLLVLFGLCFVYVIGLSNLKTDPIENDEFRTLNHIEPVWLTTARSLPETVQSVAAQSPQHGPLYFLILNVWHKLVGSDLFSLRLLSLLFAMLSVAMLYQVAAMTGRKPEAGAAALALAFLAFYAYYSRNLRMYTLLTFASAWTFWAYWQVVGRKSRYPWQWASLFLSVAVMPYVHYLGALVPAAIGVYHLLFVRKDRRWWQVSAVIALAGLVFLLWIPTVISGLVGHQGDESAAPLTYVESIRALLSIYSNGILVFPPLAVGLAWLNFRRLNAAEKYLVTLLPPILALLIVLHQFAPIFVENRMRYSLILAVPLYCAAAIGLRFIPGYPRLRIPIIAIWCLSFFYYLGTLDYATYSNHIQQEIDKVPHYQEFIYESESLPGHNDLILSFHPNMVLSDTKTLPYYLKVISKWSHIAHITYDAEGELLLQGQHWKYGSLDGIATESSGVWVLYNPSEAKLETMPVYTDWFLQHFKACKRFRETAVTIIEFYVNRAIPCDLIASESPVAIHYDNDIRLGNAASHQTGGDLGVYLWWRQTIGSDYSLSLQIFDQNGDRVQQADAVISGEPIDTFNFDVSSLASGDYAVDLIVYNFETRQSVPGILSSDQQRFERSVTIATFSIVNEA